MVLVGRFDWAQGAKDCLQWQKWKPGQVNKGVREEGKDEDAQEEECAVQGCREWHVAKDAIWGTGRHRRLFTDYLRKGPASNSGGYLH